jgi:hypothetical protein
VFPSASSVSSRRCTFTGCLNETLLTYCSDHGIVFTRSRAYHKNDQAWVEQKNGAIVRKLIGYARLEGLTATAALRRLYE